MAEGEENQAGQKTVAFGSDVIYDFYCELCKDDGINEEAQGFCVNCKEYLCGECYSGHRKSRQTRYHELQDKDSMPKKNPLPADRMIKSISTFCKLHTAETVKFYCSNHKEFACGTCFATTHKGCPDIESILEKSDKLLKSDELLEFLQNLKTLEQQSREMLAKTITNITQVQTCHAEVKSAVKHLREQIISTFDRLANDIIVENNKFLSQEEQKMTTISSQLTIIAESVNNIREVFESLHSSNQVCQLYIAMKEYREELETLQGDIRSTQIGMDVRKFKFLPSEKLKEIVRGTCELGTISCETQVADTKSDMSHRQKTCKATYLSDINVKLESASCRITGCALMHQNKMIVADRSFNAIKLIDVETNKLLSTLKLTCKPSEVAAVSANQAAVTSYSEQKILLLDVSDQLRVDSEITFDGMCRGVTYSNKRLLVTNENNHSLDVMNLRGNVVKNIKTDKDGNLIFNDPLGVCVSKDGETIYITDIGSDRLIGLSFDNVVKYVYSISNLRSEICVDHHGNVYVHDMSNNVLMLTADLSKVQVILSKNDGLKKNITSICHCEKTNRLYVGMWRHNFVKVFQLS